MWWLEIKHSLFQQVHVKVRFDQQLTGNEVCLDLRFKLGVILRSRNYHEEGMMQGRLDSKVAIVTGAGSIGEGWGNGKAVATLFAPSHVAYSGGGKQASRFGSLVRGRARSALTKIEPQQFHY